MKAKKEEPRMKKYQNDTFWDILRRRRLFPLQISFIKIENVFSVSGVYLHID